MIFDSIIADFSENHKYDKTPQDFSQSVYLQKQSPRGKSSRAFDQVGDYLFSRAVSSELSWARVSLTSVFGMGTGGTSPSSTPTDLTEPV